MLIMLVFAVRNSTGAPAGADRFDSGWEPMRTDAATLTNRPLIAVDATTLEGLLWGLVIVSLIADVVTTFVGLHLGLAEANPVARGAIQHLGLVGMLGLKFAAIGVGIACRQFLPPRYRPIVPAGLAVPWTLAAVSNLYAIWIVV